MIILFRFVSVFQMNFETTETNSFVSKWTKTNQKCALKQLKQTDLFQNEPKQTENGLKNIKSTQKTLFFREKNFLHILDRLGLNFNAINLKFVLFVDNYVTYNL